MISSYHRPATLDEALALLNRTDRATRVIGGGTTVTTLATPDTFEVVDLQALGLDGVETSERGVVIGATTRLHDVVDNVDLPDLVRELARREAPNTIRNAATIGGAVGAADPESELLAALLVHETVVTVRRPGEESELPLAAVLGDVTVLAGAILTAVTVQPGGTTASHRTARTPADRPIVAVAGRRHDGAVSLAATGVASAPVLVVPDRLDRLEPSGDFRGSAEYRKLLVAVLVGRVLAELEGEAP